MLSQSLRATRQGIAQLARRQAPTASRTFVSSATRADLVQDLYLRELKNYKAPQVNASDAEGSVQKFQVPKAPQSPEESNLANDLSSYEKQTVEVEGRSTEGGAAAEDDFESWFEDDLADEDPNAAHH